MNRNLFPVSPLVFVCVFYDLSATPAIETWAYMYLSMKHGEEGTL